MTLIILFAFVLEAACGYPQWLYALIRHPVVWMGACITVLERNFNLPCFHQAVRRVFGVLTVALLLALTLVASLAVIRVGGVLAEIVALAALFASRNLYDHVYAVYLALQLGKLPLAREKVSYIVGRDVMALDEAGVARAAIESLAESFSDGVVAPFFWAACFGLPGIACYKAINTADSMIGHRDERYLAFGWAAARLDDVANYIPARISGLLIVMVSGSMDAWRMMWRDAHKHASPNAGWPEAAMAGALGLRLGGANMYDGVEHGSSYMGTGTRDALTSHIKRALHLYVCACVMLPLLWIATIIFL